MSGYTQTSAQAYSPRGALTRILGTVFLLSHGLVTLLIEGDAANLYRVGALLAAATLLYVCAAMIRDPASGRLGQTPCIAYAAMGAGLGFACAFSLSSGLLAAVFCAALISQSLRRADNDAEAELDASMAQAQTRQA